ncbi:MAG: restriction endonuclease subunit S [Thermodesulfobacteriota bacterium]|nr:restriction endonuclease subunit S [Thermodesulfobacteriota bacterium]
MEGYCRITESANKLIASTGFAVITPKTNTGTEYIYQYLYSYNIKRQIYALVVGSNYPAVNSSDVSNLKFIIPDDPAERKAIADLLSTWDKAIEKTKRLIQAKEQFKIGQLQKLTTNNKANSTIGAFAKPIIRKVTKPSKPYVALGIRSHFKEMLKIQIRYVWIPYTRLKKMT